ncbi:ABC1 family-domain-containing protein [Geopyxis carbonaria]|nr:ABC1 family-domain-containing protein [Geopyxis carbonaria]
MHTITPIFRSVLRPIPSASPSWSRQCTYVAPRRFATTISQTKPRSKIRRRGYLLAAGTVGLVGASALGWHDGQHFINAAERALRVARGLALCINDYRTTLKLLEDDPDDSHGLLAKCHKRCAERTYYVLEKNGSIFIKLGQHLAAMGYLLPLEWTTTFIPLQDRCPVSSIESIRKMILDDTGHSVDDLFETFDPVPIGAASLAQVHRATLKENGQEVAVKLQHPALAEWIPLDMALTRFTFTNIKWFFPEYPMTWLSDEMEASLPLELNFEVEAENIHRVREYFGHIKQDLPLVVPDVIWAKKRILVLEFIPGKRLDDLEFLDSNGISRGEVSASLACIFNEMVFGTNAPLHCDPHGGNLAIRLNPNRRKRFEIILYDHGLYRDIPQDLRRSYAKLWLAVIDSDLDKMKRYAHEVAGVTDEQFPLFASAITGRDYTVLTKSVTTPRSEEEKREISTAMTKGMLAQLIQLLADVPSTILLILKTNDLTRSLEENLETGRGPERTFMIMARYCSRAVYEETLEAITRGGGLLRAGNLAAWVAALWDYWRVIFKLRAFETALSVRERLGIQA